MKSLQTRRRRVLGLIAGTALLPLVAKSGGAIIAADNDLPALIKRLSGNAKLTEGGIRLTIPELADTGFSVPVSIDVESAMSGSDIVKSIHLIAPRNPRPLVASIALSPLMARASWTTRIRLGGSQEVMAIAVMADGSARAGRADVVVSISACIDGT
ncbi:MAG: thiosulfate oxidation carrier protein SoxY [Betaproteobacteria bacterium]